MYVYVEKFDELEPWIRAEITLDMELSEGDYGPSVRRVQEWLSIHGFDIVIDGQYGPVTTRSVASFQETNGQADTGNVDHWTFEKLVLPMTEVLRQRLSESISFEHAVIQYAAAHLEQHPVEVGGQNRGPWVRLYMKGNEGASWSWCAGFVSFLMKQAAHSLQVPLPFDGSFSCDSLAAHARNVGLFRENTRVNAATLPTGSIFLVRRSETDWTHTGIITSAGQQHFDTIEGNTNDDGNREGYEVCARSRGYVDKDFLFLSRS